jgi:hypothetical protein
MGERLVRLAAAEDWGEFDNPAAAIAKMETPVQSVFESELESKFWLFKAPSKVAGSHGVDLSFGPRPVFLP